MALIDEKDWVDDDWVCPNSHHVPAWAMPQSGTVCNVQGCGLGRQSVRNLRIMSDPFSDTHIPCSNPNCNGGEIAIPVEHVALRGEWHIEYDACPDCN